MVGIETAFAVDAVEGAHLSIGRHEVYAKRNAESATMNGSKNRTWIDDGTHNACKITKYFLIYLDFALLSCNFAGNLAYYALFGTDVVVAQLSGNLLRVCPYINKVHDLEHSEWERKRKDKIKPATVMVCRLLRCVSQLRWY
jgi:hypothetical protein